LIYIKISNVNGKNQPVRQVAFFTKANLERKENILRKLQLIKEVRIIKSPKADKEDENGYSSL
jgi:hypothetical protein